MRERNIREEKDRDARLNRNLCGIFFKSSKINNNKIQTEILLSNYTLSYFVSRNTGELLLFLSFKLGARSSKLL